MPTEEKLPAVPEAAKEVAVYEPPANFEVVDRGAAESVTFQHFGDRFVGIFEYMTDATDDRTGEIFPQAIFTGADGKAYSIFPSASLHRGLGRVEPGQWVAITYDRDIDTGKPSPMKSYIVERGL